MVLSENIRDTHVQVNTRSDRVISVKLSEGNTNLTGSIQVRYDEEKKDNFWIVLDEVVIASQQMRKYSLEVT